MSKKQDSPKLMFFSDSNIENLQNEINTTIQLVKSGRLTFRNALIRLHNAKDDAMNIYWHTITKINEAQQALRTIANYHKLKGSEQVPEPLPVVSSSDPIVHQLMESFEQFKNGEIDFTTWELKAVQCLQMSKSESKSVIAEIKDILRQSKQFAKDQKDEMIQEYQDLNNEVSFEDMEIKKGKD